jgi:hypothetical protein
MAVVGLEIYAFISTSCRASGTSTSAIETRGWHVAHNAASTAMLVARLRVDALVGTPKLSIWTTTSRRADLGSKALETTRPTIVFVVAQVDTDPIAAALARSTAFSAGSAMIGVGFGINAIGSSTTRQTATGS